MRSSYDTKQKEMILDVIKKEKHEFTVKEIYEKIDGIGLTTIYRMVLKLVDEGYLSKTIGKGNVTYYQYLEKCMEDNHFYLKCDICGNLMHIDCDCIKELSNHILVNHHFTPNKERIIISGVCEKCKK